MDISRRGFLAGVGAALAAPAIVRFEALMPVRAPKLIMPDKYIITFHPSHWFPNVFPRIVSRHVVYSGYDLPRVSDGSRYYCGEEIGPYNEEVRL